VTGQVTSADGTPLPGAVLDVWQADDHGFYDVQVPDAQPPGNGRGLFTADAEAGSGSARSCPATTRSPPTRPVGSLLSATRRHPYRPAHIHFIVTADGYRPLTTHIFVAAASTSTPTPCLR